MALGEGLKKIFNKIRNLVFLDKKEIEGIIKDLQKTLLMADIDVKLVFDLTKKIKEKLLSQELKNIEKKELLTKLIYEEIKEILGEKIDLKLEKGDKILLVGLYGSGKTTTTVKLAFYFAKKGFKCCVIGLDVHRPAAPEQLKQFAEKNKVKVFVDLKEKDPLKIWKKFEKELKKFDLIFIDSAGRDALDKKLIEEIKKISKNVQPTHTILVIPADIGQAARIQAEFFAKEIKIDGIILTRMDGTAKAGGALASCKEAKAKVWFIGVGEKINDIETFDPDTYIAKLLGLGDLKGLIEKIELSVDKEKEKRIKERLKEGKFTLIDLYEQLKAMQSMGPLKKILDFIPGLSNLKIPSSLIEVQEKKLKHWKYAIDSMTPEERENPEIINSSRLSRISKGSHVPISEIKELLKQYKLIKDFLGKGIDEKKMEKIAKRFRVFR